MHVTSKQVMKLYQFREKDIWKINFSPTTQNGVNFQATRKLFYEKTVGSIWLVDRSSLSYNRKRNFKQCIVFAKPDNIEEAILCVTREALFGKRIRRRTCIWIC
jgi:hypothetical protein